MKKRLAIITTHPIQYNAPLFSLLKKRNNIDSKVFYTWGDTVLANKFDPGFGKVIEWDIDLLDGYDYEFIENVAVDKGSHHFKGIDNPSLIGKVKAFAPDGILVFGWPFKSHYRLMKYFKGKTPIIFRGDSHLLDQSNGIKSKLRMLFLRWIYRQVDKAFYVGKSNYEYYIAAGLMSDQLFFAPHAIDNNRFSADSLQIKSKANEFRKTIGIAEDDLIFLFAGKLEPKKDPEILLNAFVASNFNSNTHLVFVGNGELETQLKEISKGMNNIHFMGFCNQSDMPSVYQMASVFVLPSKGPGESWGLSVNEAMANGKPIILSDKCGCAASLVENGKNGYTFKGGNIGSLKTCLINFVNDKKNIEKMGQASLEIIQNYTFEKVAKSFEMIVN